MKNSKWTALTVLGILLYACSPKVVSTAEVKEIVLTPELAEGKTLYENNCAECHKLYAPTKHTKEGWVPTLDKMAKKAKITEEQKVSIYNYLAANL